MLRGGSGTQFIMQPPEELCNKLRSFIPSPPPF